MTTPNNADENQVYDDLLGFLKSERSDLRVAAIDAVMTAAKDREEMAKLIKAGVMAPLTKSCSHPDPVGVNALQAMAYLSANSGPMEQQCIEDLLDAGALGRMTEICLSFGVSRETSASGSWKKRINFAMALLANMTRTERGAVELVGRSLPDEAVSSDQIKEGEKLPTKPTLELLLSRFLSEQYIQQTEKQDDANDAANLDSQATDPYQHFAAVLMNSTQTEAGRQFVLKLKHLPDETTSSVLQAILPQLRSSSPIRRRGIAGTIKNCCLDTDSAFWLLEEIKLLKHILYPLAGPEELDVDEKRGLDPDLWLEGPDKVREPDHFARLYLTEAILLLCAAGRKSRESLRLSRVYVILKWADMVEEEEDVSERINECVQFLRRDEIGTFEGSSDQMVEEATKPKLLALPAPSLAAQSVGQVDLDDLD